RARYWLSHARERGARLWSRAPGERVSAASQAISARRHCVQALLDGESRGLQFDWVGFLRHINRVADDDRKLGERQVEGESAPAVDRDGAGGGPGGPPQGARPQAVS